MRRTLLYAVTLLSIVALPACSSKSSPAELDVSDVVITSSASNIAINSTDQFAATAEDGTGTPLPSVTIIWTSSAPAIISVSASGLVTGVAHGTATITASGGDRSASVTVTCGPTT